MRAHSCSHQTSAWRTSHTTTRPRSTALLRISLLRDSARCVCMRGLHANRGTADHVGLTSQQPTATNHQSPTTNHQPPTTNHQSPTAPQTTSPYTACVLDSCWMRVRHACAACVSSMRVRGDCRASFSLCRLASRDRMCQSARLSHLASSSQAGVLACTCESVCFLTLRYAPTRLARCRYCTWASCSSGTLHLAM